MKISPRWPAAIAAVAASAIVALGISAIPVQSSQRAATDTGAGRAFTCTTDSLGGCSLPHGLGTKPTAVVATVSSANGATIATSNPANTSATTFRVTFYRGDTGARFGTGVPVTFYAHFDYVPAATTPPATTPPATTPPATTPPATTPPATTPTDPGASPVKTCTNGTTIPEGSGASFFANGDEYFVHNNNWKDNYGGSHTIVACGHDNWYADVNVPEHADRAVEAYPNVHTDYNDVLVTGIDSARFAHNAADVAGMTWNAAFDVWVGQGLTNELMIWTENHGQRPAGSDVADVTFGGRTYDVWHESGYTAYVARVPFRWGTMPLASFFADMKGRGWAPANATTWQVDYGVETVDTNGAPWRFNVTDFVINDSY